MAGLAVLAGVIAIVWAHNGELIAARDGLGYDGSVYAGVVRNPSGWILDAHISGHRVQRILPSLVVHLVLRPLGLQGSDPSIIVAFQALNYGLIAWGSYIWSSIARRLALSRPATWFGFVALVGNYALLKFAGYYPVLTDTSGWFLGLCLLWCYLYRRRMAMLAVALAGAFTWPTVFYSGLLLYSLPRPTKADPAPPRRTTALAAVLALAVPAASLYSLRCGQDCVAGVMVRATVDLLVPISVVVLAIWLFLGTRPLLARLPLGQLRRSLDLSHAAIAVGLLVAVSLLQARFSSPSELTLLRTLHNISLGGIAKPAGFVVAGTIYFGPAVLLAIAWWRRIVPRVADQGPALVLLLLGYLMLAVDLEARKFMNIWPFVATFTAVVVDRLGWSGRQVRWFAVLSLVASRVWLPLNRGELTGDHGAYPDQWYFMSMGPRMTDVSFVVMLAATVLMALALWWIQRRGGEPATERPSPDDGARIRASAPRR